MSIGGIDQQRTSIAISDLRRILIGLCLRFIVIRYVISDLYSMINQHGDDGERKAWNLLHLRRNILQRII